MRSGDLTHRIVLQRSTEAQDAFGGAIPTWSDLAQVWAAVDWNAGSETFQADRDYAEVPASIRVRRSTDTMSVREKDRALVPMAATTLKDAIGNSTATSMVLTDPGVMPPFADFVVRIGSELLQVTAGAGTSASPYTVTRGVFSSSADRHQAGESVIQLAAFDIVSVRPSRYSIDMTGIRSEVRAP